MNSSIGCSQLNSGDQIQIRSKKSNDNHDGCIFKVKSVSPAGWVSFDVVSINGKSVKKGDRSLKPSGGFEGDYEFIRLIDASETETVIQLRVGHVTQFLTGHFRWVKARKKGVPSRNMGQLERAASVK